MIKLLGCVMILVASTGIGFILGESFKKRTKQLNEFHRCIVQLQNEIVYTHTALPEAISDVAKKSIHPVKDIFEEVSSLLSMNIVDNVFEAFNRVIDNKINHLNLKKDDINILLDLAKNLGESDIDGQQRMFALVVDNIKKQIRNSENLMNSNVKMYRYLGFCSGAVVVIILV